MQIHVDRINKWRVNATSTTMSNNIFVGYQLPLYYWSRWSSAMIDWYAFTRNELFWRSDFDHIRSDCDNWPLTSKSDLFIFVPNCTRVVNSVKFSQVVCKILCSSTKSRTHTRTAPRQNGSEITASSGIKQNFEQQTNCNQQTSYNSTSNSTIKSVCSRHSLYYKLHINIPLYRHSHSYTDTKVN